MKKIRRIGLLTSGGDCPGMNACIRAVVRAALFHKVEPYGIMHGYDGMIANEIIPLASHAVSNIIHRGGTILKTARSEAFRTPEGRKKAHANLEIMGIDGLVVIGGDGSFKGALALQDEYDIPVVGIPGTIDNDLAGTEFTLGFDTAVNTAIQAIDKVKDTAASHDRLFFVEVMGRDSGFIALWSGVGSGVEEVLLPETVTDIGALVTLLSARKKKKKSTIVVVAEGDEAGGALRIADKVKKKVQGFDTRVTILGHLQRGGSPTALDRILATRFGVTAVEALLAGETSAMTGIIGNKVKLSPLKDAVKSARKPDPALIRYIKMMSI